MQQVNKDHYDFAKYSHVGRWASYYYQLRTVLGLKPSSILEIGVGDKVFGSFLRNNTEVEYKSLDIAEDLHPDIVGEVGNIPVKDGCYDIVCAFEVLEHIPFDKFENAVKEMMRVARNHVIISVPHFGPPILFQFKLPFMPLIKFAWKFPFPRKHEFNGEHYWELGKSGYPVKRIRKVLSSLGTVTDEFVPFENQYHHFFVVKK